MLIPIIPIYVYIIMFGKISFLHSPETIAIGGGISLLCIWYTFILWFLGVVPFLRGRPKIYDLLESQVRIIFEDGSQLILDFNDILGLFFERTIW